MVIRGFAFVCMARVEDSLQALSEMNDAEIDGRRIRVEKAKRKEGYEKTPGVCKLSRNLLSSALNGI